MENEKACKVGISDSDSELKYVESAKAGNRASTGDKLPYFHLLFLIQVGVLYSKITDTEPTRVL